MRIALLGAGDMGALHANIYHELPGVKVAMIYGRDLNKITPLASKLGALATTDLETVLSDETIEAVDVCVPSAMHHELVIPALKAGKHVFCETPLALTLERAQAMLDASKSSNRLLLVGLLMRSVAEYQYIKQALNSGELGRPIAVYAHRLSAYLRQDDIDHKEHYGDPTTELMTFDFDVLNWLFGQPQEVYAISSNLPDGRPGYIMASLKYDNIAAEVEASGIMPSGFPFIVGLRLVCEKQVLELSIKSSGDGPPTTTFTKYAQGGEPHEVKLEDFDPYQAECMYFLNCIQGKADPTLLSAERAIEALKLSLATQEAIKQAQLVRLY